MEGNGRAGFYWLGWWKVSLDDRWNPLINKYEQLEKLFLDISVQGYYISKQFIDLSFHWYKRPETAILIFFVWCCCHARLGAPQYSHWCFLISSLLFPPTHDPKIDHHEGHIKFLNALMEVRNEERGNPHRSHA